VATVTTALILFGIIFAGKITPSYPTTATFHELTSTSQSTFTPSSLDPAGPSPSSGPVLQPLGAVPQDIGATREAERLLLCDLRDEGMLGRSIDRDLWANYHGRRFLVAPTSVATSEITQTIVSIDAISGHVVYMHFENGQRGGWQELKVDTRFLRRPAVLSRAQGRVDIVNVDSNDQMWTVSYDGSVWRAWTNIGSSITTDVAATSSDENRIDVFGRNDSSVLHTYWTSESGWAGEWVDLGIPSTLSSNEFETPSPLAVSWREHEGDSVIEVVVHLNILYHKLFRNGAWGDWIMMPSSHEGVEHMDTQSFVKGNDIDDRPFAHMDSRGTDDRIHYSTFNDTDWSS
jgi:hypothetical protein